MLFNTADLSHYGYYTWIGPKVKKARARFISKSSQELVKACHSLKVMEPQTFSRTKYLHWNRNRKHFWLAGKLKLHSPPFTWLVNPTIQLTWFGHISLRTVLFKTKKCNHLLSLNLPRLPQLPLLGIILLPVCNLSRTLSHSIFRRLSGI